MAHVISFMGAPAVGKTYIAERLSEQQGITYFDREVLLDKVFGDERDTPRYIEAVGPLTEASWIWGIDNARRGISSINESPMKPAIQGKSASFIDGALKAAAEYGFNVTLIHCVAPEEVVLANMKGRGSPRDEPKYDDWQKFCRDFLDVSGPKYEHLVVDTTKPVEDNLVKIVSYMASQS